MNRFMSTPAPDFCPAQDFAFQNAFQSRAEEEAYYALLDRALYEIEYHAFCILSGKRLSVPNPSGCVFRHEFICLLVENLRQHEMPSGGKLYYRSYLADEPIFGLRIEFLGAGLHPLPQALTAQKWFAARNRPWNERVAPVSAIQGGESHTAISDLFDEAESRGLAEVVSLGWREVDKQQGPLPGGHIIALHFAVKPDNGY